MMYLVRKNCVKYEKYEVGNEHDMNKSVRSRSAVFISK